MERARHAGARPPGGFTLVELLVVMGIIGLLVSLLLPAVNQAIVAVRAASTRHTIASLSAGLEAFKADWGVFPPSDKSHGDNLVGWDGRTWGYELMPLALMGPNGKGWGAPEQNKSPFGGAATGTYGPYFVQEKAIITSYVADGFMSPQRFVLYYRFEPNDPSGVTGLFGLFDFNDNPSTNLNEGFASSLHFNLTAQSMDPAAKTRWQREDYLLISAGADRLYGYVKNTDPPTAATLNDVRAALAFCDDITNVE